MSCECTIGGQGIDFNIRTTKQGSKECTVDSSSKYEITITNYRPQGVDYALWSDCRQGDVLFNDNGVELTACAIVGTIGGTKQNSPHKNVRQVDISPFQAPNGPEKIEIEARFSDSVINTKTEEDDSVISVSF